MKEVFEARPLDEGTRVRSMFTHNRVTYGLVGNFALDLARQLASAVMPDGETSCGENKFRLMQPEEVVSRALEITELTFAGLTVRGWVKETPPLDELIDDQRWKPGFGSGGGAGAPGASGGGASGGRRS